MLKGVIEQERQKVERVELKRSQDHNTIALQAKEITEKQRIIDQKDENIKQQAAHI